jgi:hypothetical protein
MLTFVTLASTMICFQSFFALFVKVLAYDLLSMNEYDMSPLKKKKIAEAFAHPLWSLTF